MKLSNHPTVLKHNSRTRTDEQTEQKPIDATWLREVLLKAGADDVGFVEIKRPEIDDQREDILKHFPYTQTLISYVVRTNREPLRTPARSVANLEFHQVGHKVNEIGRHVVRTLEGQGVKALNPAMGFPMEVDEFPGKIWVVGHKPVAVAAGLGQMGIHRLVIHPKFGNFILLATLLMDARVTKYDQPIEYNPCLECKLCVAACPTGAISPTGVFDFSACYSHNYKEFMGGFTDWTEHVVASKNVIDYRSRVTDAESASMWQSLSYGANYKAAYCMSVCPAGEDVIGPYLNDKKAHMQQNVRPLQQKKEIVYVLKNSDAEGHVAKRFPQKQIKHVGNSLRPNTIEGFLFGAPLVFQPGKSADLNATYHFTFTGDEEREATFTIRNQTLHIEEGHQGKPDLHVTADAKTWVAFLRQEKNIVWAIVRRKVRLKGPLKLLVAFGNCFPG